MTAVLLISSVASALSLAAWVYLVKFRGRFWMTDVNFEDDSRAAPPPAEWPAIRVVVPARNEADTLPKTLPTLLEQDYDGEFRIVLVDDQSEDGTADVARQLAGETNAEHRLEVIEGGPLPSGWTGKLWAMQQGVSAEGSEEEELLLFTDADIEHPHNSLRSLTAKLVDEDLDLASLMVQLRTDASWEKFLIPAFVYFFCKLYPFRWVNRPGSRTAGAAGGCLLLRRKALENAGGLAGISDRIIDDCALARIIKAKGREGGGRLWLGLSREVRSRRGYGCLAEIWQMVSRTAFTQLRHSVLLLLGTVAGMLLVYVVPPIAAASGLATLCMGGDAVPGAVLCVAGSAAWGLMTLSYLPMLSWYGVSHLVAPSLPLSALLYTMMTVDSARRTWQGAGGLWKGRTYETAEQDRGDAKRVAEEP